MPLPTRWFFLVALVVASVPAHAADEGGFVPMFNGRDLSGWVNVNCAPETWIVRDGVIHCTGIPTGALRTERQYENFILELEWRHLRRSGNSGVFIWGSPINAPGVPFLRGIEVQVLDHGYAEDYERKHGRKSESFTTHGDVFPIHGATMKPIGRTNGRRSFPSEDRSRPSPEWNHYRIVAQNGSLRLYVNGAQVSGGDDCNYRKGYLALESEGSPVEFRHVRIKELPSTSATPEVTAPIDPGWQSLFNGVDLRGWGVGAGAAPPAWAVRNERLTPEATADAKPEVLWTAREFGDAEFVLDYQPPKSAAGETDAPLVVWLRGRQGSGTPVTLPAGAPGRYARYVITVQGRQVRVHSEGRTPLEMELPADTPAQGALGLGPETGGGLFMNLHVRSTGFRATTR